MSRITQLSIFVNNEPGAIANISKTLREENINLRAFCIAEGSGFGVLRAIADDPHESCAKLKKRSIIVKETEVIGIPMVDQPGSLFEVTRIFGENNINIEYAYAYAGVKNAAVFFRVNDVDNAEAVLEKLGVKTLSASDL